MPANGPDSVAGEPARGPPMPPPIPGRMPGPIMLPPMTVDSTNMTTALEISDKA